MRQMRARKPDNAASDRACSASVLARDGRVCRMQRYNPKLKKYVEHGVKGTPENPLDCAHIFGRPHLSPATQFQPIVCLSACRTCHTKYDAHDDEVRVPPQRHAAALRYIERAKALGEIKVMPPPRIPPDKPLEQTA